MTTISILFHFLSVDAEQLIYRYLRGDDDHPDDPLARELQRAFFYNNSEAKCKAIGAIIDRRVLLQDTLSKGWVLVNYPHTLLDFKQMMETWKVPPNKIVYLHCSEVMCLKRLGEMPLHVAPSDNFIYYEQEVFTLLSITVYIPLSYCLFYFKILLLDETF